MRRATVGSVVALHLSQNPEADRLLSEDPLALLIGMVLDQQVPLERAFSAPLDLQDRLGRPPRRRRDGGHGPRRAGGGVLGPARPAPLSRRQRQAGAGAVPHRGRRVRREGGRHLGRRPTAATTSSAGSGRCRASASRRPASLSACSASSSACGRRGGRRPPGVSAKRAPFSPWPTSSTANRSGRVRAYKRSSRPPPKPPRA